MRDLRFRDVRFSASLLALAGLGLVGCSQGAPGKQAAAPPAAPQPSTPTGTTAPARAPAPSTSPALSLQAVNAATYAPAAAQTPAPEGEGANTTGPGDANPGEAAADPTLIKAEVLLDRANFAPGVIDGRMGENVSNALKAYDHAQNLPVSGTLDQATWNSLTSADKAPVLTSYTITQADVAGPWSPDVGEDFVKMAALPSLGFSDPKEMLASRFHMDQGLLEALNPGVDFAKPGAQITVVATGAQPLPEVASIDVNKATKSVTALGGDGQVLAVFPATVGSTERPSPKGTWKVKGVAQHPDYVYDPSKLTWGPKKAGKLRIAPGPHNPVGVVWIALTAPDYGIHGTPDPRLVGKTASHGCVRLTNWDAEELSKAVKPGVKVTFVNSGASRSG